VPLEAAFRRDQNPPAAAVGSERPPDNFLGKAEAVGGCRVDHVDAMIDRGLDRAKSAAHIAAAPHPAAYRPGAQSDPRSDDIGAADFNRLHLALAVGRTWRRSIRPDQVFPSGFIVTHAFAPSRCPPARRRPTSNVASARDPSVAVGLNLV